MGKIADAVIFHRDLSKTGILISALEAQKKPAVFFALDVDYKELQRSLHDLVTSIKPRFVEIRGLLGTYDDCATWLNQDASLTFHTITIIWLGSSIANLEISEARDLLSRFVGHSQRNRRMIVAADGCADERKIRRAYDLVGDQSRLFVMNGLCHANRIVGSDQFRNTDWAFQGRYSTTGRTFYSSVVAQRDVTLHVGGVHVRIGKGEEILMIRSAKWSGDKLARICKTARVRVSNTWKNAHGYSKFLYDSGFDMLSGLHEGKQASISCTQIGKGIGRRPQLQSSAC